MATHRPLEAYRGQPFTFSLEGFTDGAATTSDDWTGYQFLFQVRATVGKSSPLLLEMDVSLTGDPARVDFYGIVDQLPRLAYYDIRVIPAGGEAEYWLEGPFVTSGNVSRDE